LNIQQEYIKLKEEIKNTTKPEILPADYPQRENYNIIQVQQTSSRQEKILTFLKEKERLQVKDLKNVFPEISKRTLRRDFEQLLKKGLVVRMGEKNNTFYQVS
jgi:predicted HTH transcriptional regulator